MTKEFSVDISKFIDKAEGSINAFMLEFTQDLAEEIVTTTPVDTGFLRSSWTVNLSSPDLSTQGRETSGNQAAATQASLNRITANLIGIEGGDIIYYTNNAGYGHFVEFGTSRMAGRGFVRAAVNKSKSIAKKALTKVKK